MTKWEYRIEEAPNLEARSAPDCWQTRELLNALGKEGWELIGASVHATSTRAVLYLKREVEKEPPPDLL